MKRGPLTSVRIFRPKININKTCLISDDYSAVVVVVVADIVDINLRIGSEYKHEILSENITQNIMNEKREKKQKWCF